MNANQLKILKTVFWISLALTTIGFLGSITETIVQSKKSKRTAESGGAPIAVPADATGGAR